MANPLIFSRNNDGPNLNSPQTFSGSDTAVIFSIPGINPSKLIGGSTLESVQLQTITISSATSINPVRRLGEAKVAQFTRGGRSFAGSMVFTMIGQDPFQQIFGIDTVRSSIRTDGQWHIDQMPPFDAIILCQNETGGVGMQIISNISLANWGTTYSIDDMYTESTYTYFAEHVTPFINNKFDSFKGINGESIQEKMSDLIDSMHTTETNPDRAFKRDSDSGGAGDFGISRDLQRDIAPGTTVFVPDRAIFDSVFYDSPEIPPNI